MNTTALNSFEFPPLDLLKTYDNESVPVVDSEEQTSNKDCIINTLCRFGIDVSVKVSVGFRVSLYEIEPKERVTIAQIAELEDEIMYCLGVNSIRFIAPMPGKGTIGIEIPNRKPQIVSMHSVVKSKRFQEENEMRLPIGIGKTTANEVFMFDLAKVHHLLISGATGQGKTVCLQALITSLLYKKRPDELKFVLMDEKQVEFPPYKDLLRHYLAATSEQQTPDDIIVSDCDKAIDTLNSLEVEMEKRYQLLKSAGARNIEEYNDQVGQHRMPYIVIIIDEFADFLLYAGKQVETPLVHLAEKAHNIGMHMVLATQRPSFNVITKTLKANFPARIAFRCKSTSESRTVLDSKGAEALVGNGDMLYSAGGDLIRIQCAYVDESETTDIVKHICEQPCPCAPYTLPEVAGKA